MNSITPPALSAYDKRNSFAQILSSERFFIVDGTIEAGKSRFVTIDVNDDVDYLLPFYF